MTRYAQDGTVITIDDARAFLAHHGARLVYTDETVPSRPILVAAWPWWRHVLEAIGIGPSRLVWTLDVQDDLEHRVMAGMRMFVQLRAWRLW